MPVCPPSPQLSRDYRKGGASNSTAAAGGGGGGGGAPAWNAKGSQSAASKAKKAAYAYEPKTAPRPAPKPRPEARPPAEVGTLAKCVGTVFGCSCCRSHLAIGGGRYQVHAEKQAALLAARRNGAASAKAEKAAALAAAKAAKEADDRAARAHAEAHLKLATTRPPALAGVPMRSASPRPGDRRAGKTPAEVAWPCAS